MADMIGVKLQGAKKLRSTLKAAGLDMKDLSALNRQAAQTVLPVAKSLAPTGSPVNGHIKTTIRVGATQKAGVIRAGTNTRPYAGPIHWGWPARNITAQPWIADAAKQTEGRWVDIYWRDLIKTINKVKGD